jgi:hypothetical protein
VPLHWCEVAAARALGPDATAALARALWARRAEGIRAVQLVEVRAARPGELGDTAYGGELTYREAVGRERAGRLEIWDPADCAWLRQRPAGASGHVLSLRVGGSKTALRWGEHRLTAGSWTTLGAAAPEA